MTVPPGFVVETIQSGFTLPTDFAFARDGRIFVAEKAGRVWVVQNGQRLRTPFIDLSNEVNSMFDRGLLGLALHPDFPATPYLYLAYTYEPPEAAGYSQEGSRTARIVRVTAAGNVAAAGSAVVLAGAEGGFAAIGNPDKHDTRPWSCEDPDRTPYPDCLPADGMAHTIGALVFGPDGALYAANGDGIVDFSGSMRAQTLESLAGKILRIDPLIGDGYANNPFYDGDPSANRSKVFVYGMRNPFRFAFHPVTGRLLVADVGNNGWEEITLAAAGDNLGWPCFEGPEATGISPTCGGLYTGKANVKPLYAYPHGNGRGAVIGGAFYTGATFPARYHNAFFYGDFNASTIDYLVVDANGTATSATFAEHAVAPVQMRVGADGSLYVLLIASGALVRIRYAGGASREPANAPAVAAASPSETAPTVTIDSPDAGARYRLGDQVTLAGSAVDAGGAAVPPDGLRWEAVLHHNDHVHYDTYHHAGPTGTFTYDDHGDNSYVELCLIAKATAGGEEGRACRDLYAQETTVTLESDPPGLPISYEGAVRPAPYQVVTYAGARRTVAVVPGAGSGLTFAGWSDGVQELSRSLEVGDSPMTLVARFTGAENVDAAEQAAAPDELGEGETEASASAAAEASQVPEDRAESAGPASAVPPANSSTGHILREYWTGIGGKEVADLVKSEAYQGAPAGYELLPRLEAPNLFANDFGERIRGYIVPPVTGVYTFWIAADDSAELWLSVDTSPARARLIASVPAWTSIRQWDKYAEQQSFPIRLEAGRSYYIEVLHKEADQKDNLAVAWEIPGQVRAVIDGAYLAPIGD